MSSDPVDNQLYRLPYLLDKAEAISDIILGIWAIAVMVCGGLAARNEESRAECADSLEEKRCHRKSSAVRLSPSLDAYERERKQV